MPNKKQARKENMYLDSLDALVGEYYRKLNRNVDYARGEIDMLARRWASGVDIYEVKSTGHPRAFNRAESQLTRASYLFPYNIQDMYVYIGDSSELYHFDGYDFYRMDVPLYAHTYKNEWWMSPP